MHLHSAALGFPCRKNWLAEHPAIVPHCADSQFDVSTAMARLRADAWQRGISELFTDLSPDIGDPEVFTGSVETIYRTNISISHIAAGAQRMHRQSTHSRGRWLNRYYLNVQIEGSSHVRHERGSTLLETGDCVLVNPNEAYILDFAAPFRQLCLQIPEWWLAEKLQRPLHSVTGMPVSRARGSGTVLRSALKAVIGSPQDNADMPELIELLGDVLGRTMRISADAPIADASGPAQRTMFDRVADYIWRNFRDETIAPADAAKALGCSTRYIHKVCAVQGTTFRNLLIDTRLSAAARALLYGDSGIRISTICYDSGFVDISHFNRLFRRKFGATPRTYRQSGH